MNIEFESRITRGIIFKLDNIHIEFKINDCDNIHFFCVKFNFNNTKTQFVPHCLLQSRIDVPTPRHLNIAPNWIKKK